MPESDFIKRMLEERAVEKTQLETPESLKAAGARPTLSFRQAPEPTLVQRVTEPIPPLIRGAILPTALGAAAAFLPPVGPAVGGVVLSRLLAEMGFSVLGETINQITGITESGVEGLVTAGATPGVSRVGGGAIIRGAKGLARAVFKPFSLATLSEATEEALKYPETLRRTMLTGQTSQQLFADVHRMGAANVDIPLLRTFGAAQTWETQVDKSLEFAKQFGGKERAAMVRTIKKAINELKPQKGPTGQFTTGTKHVDFELLENSFHDINQGIDTAYVAGNKRSVALGKALKAAVYEDIEKAADPLAGPIKAKYLEAAKTFRKEKAIETIEDIIENAAKGQRPFGDARFLKGAMLDRYRALLRDDPLFTGSFTATEREAIRSTFAQWDRLPEVGFQTGDVVLATLIGGTVGKTLATEDPGQGAILGSLAGIAGSRIIANAVGSSIGRTILLKLAKDNKGFLDRPALAAIGNAIAGGLRSQSQEITQERQRRLQRRQVLPEGVKEIP